MQEVNHWEHVLVSIKHQVAQLPNSPDRSEFLPEMGNVTMSCYIQFEQFCSNVQVQAFCKVVWYMNMCVFCNGKGMFSQKIIKIPVESHKSSDINGFPAYSMVIKPLLLPLLYIVSIILDLLCSSRLHCNLLYLYKLFYFSIYK